VRWIIHGITFESLFPFISFDFYFWFCLSFFSPFSVCLPLCVFCFLFSLPVQVEKVNLLLREPVPTGWIRCHVLQPLFSLVFNNNNNDNNNNNNNNTRIWWSWWSKSEFAFSFIYLIVCCFILVIYRPFDCGRRSLCFRMDQRRWSCFRDLSKYLRSGWDQGNEREEGGGGERRRKTSFIWALIRPSGGFDLEIGGKSKLVRSALMTFAAFSVPSGCFVALQCQFLLLLLLLLFRAQFLPPNNNCASERLRDWKQCSVECQRRCRADVNQTINRSFQSSNAFFLVAFVIKQSHTRWRRQSASWFMAVPRPFNSQFLLIWIDER